MIILYIKCAKTVGVEIDCIRVILSFLSNHSKHFVCLHSSSAVTEQSQTGCAHSSSNFTGAILSD